MWMHGGVEDISKPTPAFVLIGLLCGISPSLSAILIARVNGGKAGLKALFDRFKQKNSRSILVLALLIVPAVAAVTLLISNLTVHALIMTYLYRRSGGNLKLMVLYHYTITAAAILPGAFFKFTSLPQYTVWEGVVSVSLRLGWPSYSPSRMR